MSLENQHYNKKPYSSNCDFNYQYYDNERVRSYQQNGYYDHTRYQQNYNLSPESKYNEQYYNQSLPCDYNNYIYKEGEYNDSYLQQQQNCYKNYNNENYYSNEYYNNKNYNTGDPRSQYALFENQQDQNQPQSRLDKASPHLRQQGVGYGYHQSYEDRNACYNNPQNQSYFARSIYNEGSTMGYVRSRFNNEGSNNTGNSSHKTYNRNF